ncbi:MAG TPA: 8-amino-7-oxononanoate synthase [Candidatus Kapabacteria bacterium]|nr:8-amino-7-oxononanoate synthase [Candidatus Kapabacteria bacterium]
MSAKAFVASNVEPRLEQELEALEKKGRQRSLQLSDGIDFTSNDYLGLTKNSDLKKHLLNALSRENMLLGSGGSRLLRGNHVYHEQAEADFAAFSGSEASLFFTSGYAANMAVLTAIPTRHDLIVFDSLVHASIREGIHASLAAKKSFQHNSLETLESSIKTATGVGAIYVVVESLYSMDGDESPLHDLAELCTAYGASLIVDEAHAAGLLGTHGSGLIDEAGIRDEVFISVYPCGKALASAGAFVCSSPIVKEYLINRARTMIFTTALPPLIPFQLSFTLKLIQERRDLREQVFKNAAIVRSSLQEHLNRWHVLPGRSPIIPLIIGDEEEAIAVGKALQGRGLDVRPIRPPTVAEGSSRFRLTVNALHTHAELQLLTDSIIGLEGQFIS